MEAVAAGSLWRCRPAAPPLRRATTCPARPSPGHGLPPPGRLTEQAGFLAWWQVGNQSRQMLSRCRNLSREGGWLPRHTAGRAAFFSLRRLPVCLSRHLQDHLRPLSPRDARRAPKYNCLESDDIARRIYLATLDAARILNESLQRFVSRGGGGDGLQSSCRHYGLNSRAGLAPEQALGNTNEQAHKQNTS